jgi:urea transport system substrate-binding protein
MRRFATTAIALTASICVFGFAAAPQPRDTEPVKVGILHSLTGTMAISESSLKDVELMAIVEINAAGGVLGKKIQPVVEDPASQFTTSFPEKAKKLVVRDKVAAVFGCWTSVSRKNVLPVFEEYNGLLFYPVAYEGNECSKNVIYAAPTPNQQVIPAIDWILSNKGAGRKKIYFIGTDYVFPRMAFLIARKHLKTMEIEPVGETFVPFAHRDFAGIIQDIKESGATAVFSCLNGDSNVNLYNELAAQGVTPEKCPVIATLIGEDELRGLDPSKVKGHYSVQSYFQSLDTPKNKEFVRRFQARYGRDRITDYAIASAYASVHLWKLAVEKAQSFDLDRVRAAISQVEFDAPEGKLKVSPKTFHTNKAFLVGRIRDDKQFDIVHRTESIEADPYPQVAFPGWSCDWTKGPPVKGRPVDIIRR